MSRMDAKRRKTRAVELRFSQSLASLRHRFRPAIDRSTIPRLGKQHKSFGLIAGFDDRDLYTRQNAGERADKDRPLIGAVGEQSLEKRKPAKQHRKQRDAAA